MSKVRRIDLIAVALVAGIFLFAPGAARAGCGCDHPPPDFTLVMPPFASPGKTIWVHADGFAFTLGATYEVDFGHGKKVDVVATDADLIEAIVPPGVDPGPVDLRVKGPGLDHSYASNLFTALAPAPVIPAGDGNFILSGFEMSVTEDGTVLIPFNLSQVLDATQFVFQIGGARLAFDEDDVVFHNEDGIDLTLFTLDVADPTQRQWGSYYGWTVEQDTGILGDVFDSKRRGSLSMRLLSDSLYYWRHEFHSYANAHLPGGSHAVGADGFHTSLGTLHVDHDHLVLAIRGMERSFWEPEDATALETLDPGSRWAHIFVGTRLADNPVEPEELESMLFQAIISNQLTVLEVETPGAYDDDDD